MALAILQLDKDNHSFAHGEIHAVTTTCTGVPHIDAFRGFLPEPLIRICTNPDEVFSMAFLQIESVEFCRDVLMKVSDPRTVCIAYDVLAFESGGRELKPKPNWSLDKILSHCMVDMKTVNLEIMELGSEFVPAQELYYSCKFHILTKLKMPARDGQVREEVACFLNNKILYGKNNPAKTTAILPREKNMGEEIAKQANAEIEKRREAGEAGLISELKKVEMEKVYYAVDSSGSVTELGEKIVTSGKDERKIKVKVTNGSSLMPQLYPHTNVRLKIDNSNRTDDTLTVRFFFVPERLQNTIGGVNK